MIQRLAALLLPLMLALYAAPASAHGCHQGWQQSPEGLHRHGSKCERREGVTHYRKQRNA
jgi:hypothetical protein